MRKITILVIALVSVLVLGAVTQAVGAKVVKSKSSISASYSPGSGDPYFEDAKFKGKVKSKKAPCVKKRKVVVKTRAGEKVGSDLTNKQGKFAVDASGFGPDKYDVNLKKSTVKKGGKKYKCGAAKATVKVT
jgi:hypothetical protein